MTTRRLPRQPITPAQPIQGEFIVTNIVYESDYGLKTMRIELTSHGEVKVNRFPTRNVTLVEVTP